MRFVRSLLPWELMPDLRGLLGFEEDLKGGA